MLLTPKKDGTLRFCVDFRLLNALTIPDTYPLPRMEDCIDSLGEARLFTTLDALWGYWQVPIAERDRDKTTFTSHMGTFRYKRMPFGLRNAPATFQRTLDIMLSDVRWKTCLVYIDDVVIFSKTEEEHFAQVSHVLTFLEEDGVKLKLKKCFFFHQRVEYLGHVITPGLLSERRQSYLRGARSHLPRVDHATAQLLRRLQLLPTFREGLLQDRIPPFRYAAKKTPATTGIIRRRSNCASSRNLRRDEPGPQSWPCPRRTQQDEIDPTSWVTIGYWSKTLTKEQRNYSATERECYAVVWANLTLRPYIEGTRFVVRTDHTALRWMMTTNDPQGRLMRLRLRLMEFDYEIVYRPGRVHQVADVFSRLLREGGTEDDATIDEEIPFFGDQHQVQPEPAQSTRERGRARRRQPAPPIPRTKDTPHRVRPSQWTGVLYSTRLQ